MYLEVHMAQRKRRPLPQRPRRRIPDAPKVSAQATHTKPRGAFRLFSNYRLFAIVGGVSMFAAYGLSVVSSGTISAHVTSGNSGVRGDGVRREASNEPASTPSAPRRTVRQYAASPLRTIDPSHQFLAVIETDKGNVQVVLHPDEAPDAVNNFVFLARDGFYDGITFHRVIPGFVAQAGDPTGTGLGGPGYDLPFEPSSGAFAPGILAVAKPSEAGARNNGSQFFFALGRHPALDGESTVLGHVVAGMDVIERLAPRDPQQEAAAPARNTIRSIKIVEA
jgi:cyclophilin family peptidyl-prolyl cis-trans isomerase